MDPAEEPRATSAAVPRRERATRQKRTRFEQASTEQTIAEFGVEGGSAPEPSASANPKTAESQGPAAASEPTATAPKPSEPTVMRSTGVFSYTAATVRLTAALI